MSAQTQPPSEARFVQRTSASPCVQKYHQTKAISYSRSVWNRQRVTRKAKARLVHQRRCAYSGKARQNIRRKNRVFREKYRERQQLERGGGNPIPTYITACESGGSYTAENPSSGAYGKYQIMPFHWQEGGICYGLSRSPGDQDTCAARIWNSSGPGAWDCA